MPLINCPECRKPVSEAANACPGCGFTLTPDVVAVQKRKGKANEQRGMVGCGTLVVLMLLICWAARSASPGCRASVLLAACLFNEPNEVGPIFFPGHLVHA
jgi:hypothetical protein